MKQITKKIFLSIILVTFILPAMAQSTVGKDFWVTFLPNHEHDGGGYHFPIPEPPHRLELIVTGKHS